MRRWRCRTSPTGGWDSAICKKRGARPPFEQAESRRIIRATNDAGHDDESWLLTVTEAPPQGDTITLDLGGGVTMELVRIRAGTFQMGSNNGDGDERPVHEVTISRDFYIGRYEVTQAQYEAVMGHNPAWFDNCGGDCPVERVSWHNAVAFAEELTRMTGYAIRLPTEAEWEYACRAGTTTEYSFGDDAGLLGGYAWYRDNSNSRTHPVGGKLPNAWGLYDMHGNVWEWCNDWYDSDYYENSPPVDPQGPGSGTNRVPRGGSWFSGPWYLRSANRLGNGPDYRNLIIGFRVAAGT